MSLLNPAVILQLIAWLSALIEFTLALYILLLNVRHSANRHVAGLLTILSVNALGLGVVFGAADAKEATWGVLLLSATGLATTPGLFITGVVLLRPTWVSGRWRWLWRLLYVAILIPILLTAVDAILQTDLMYTALNPETYSGGYADRDLYMGGSLARPLRIVAIYVLGLVPVGPLVYIVLFDRQTRAADRRLGWILLVTQIQAIVIQVALGNVLPVGVPPLIINLGYVVGYAYAAFQQMISERRAQSGRLQVRLTMLVVAVTVPVFVAATAIQGAYTGSLLREGGVRDLQALSQSLKSSISVWLDLNVRSLQQSALQPEVISMDADRQKPVVEAMAAAHPHMYLVSTTDLSGWNVARSDGGEITDYSDQEWFRRAREGAPVTYQTVIGSTSQRPVLVVSMPVESSAGELVGVIMFASMLDQIAEETRVNKVGETGFAYVVDDNNRVVAHPDLAYTQGELRDMSLEVPVASLRAGERGLVSFEEDGRRWFAYVDELSNGWGVVAQQQEADLLADRRPLLQISWGVLGIGTLVVVLLTYLAVRQAFRPILPLTAAATAIAEGDLEQQAPVESEDEIGVLARAFNAMTDQLRRTIGGLEQRVSERTADLEHRSSYLEAATAVSRSAASVLDVEQLIRTVVELIQERFSLYYVGLFLTDDAQEWAVLRAGTGKAGEEMLAQGHRLSLDATSMIGRCVLTGTAEIQLDVGESSVRFANPLLPDTRSELALPLRSRERTIGAMTVQSTRSAAFDEADMSVLQTMADQVALAIENARLISESTAALEESRRLSGEVTSRAWADLLRTRPDWGYQYRGGQVANVAGEWSPEMTEALRTGRTTQYVVSEKQDSVFEDAGMLAIPLRVRQQTVGVLGFRRRDESRAWTDREIEVLELLVGQMGDALVGAQLYESAQQSATREQLVGDLASRMRQTLDVESVLRTAVQEVRSALDLPEVVVRLGGPVKKQTGATGDAYDE